MLGNKKVIERALEDRTKTQGLMAPFIAVCLSVREDEKYVEGMLALVCL